MSASFTWPKPCPPRSGGRWVAQRPRPFTSCWRSAMMRLRVASSTGRTSSGMIASRTNSRIQASFSSNSGSVLKSQLIGVSLLSGGRGWSPDLRVSRLSPVLVHRGVVFGQPELLQVGRPQPEVEGGTDSLRPLARVADEPLVGLALQHLGPVHLVDGKVSRRWLRRHVQRAAEDRGPSL